MALKQPENMGELVYFTRRNAAEGKIVAWVFREQCPKCKKELMGKPRDEKGKIKIRAKEYVCPACNYTLGMQEYEDTLTTNIEYSCANCGNSGEIQAPYKRKTFQGAKAIVFDCQKCGKKIPITKKMKETKETKAKNKAKQSEASVDADILDTDNE